MVIVSQSSNCGEPLSLTRTVIVKLPICDDVGVQLNAPLELLMTAPAGAPESSENVRVFAGKSGSVAAAVKVISLPQTPLLCPIAPSTGARFTSLTLIDTS